MYRTDFDWRELRYRIIDLLFGFPELSPDERMIMFGHCKLFLGVGEGCPLLSHGSLRCSLCSSEFKDLLE
jgi:hypothetical protein